MSYMFRNASSFNQNIGGWNTGSVRRMIAMFYNASSFNQNIGGWNIGSLSSAGYMFSGDKLSTANYDALLKGWDAQNPWHDNSDSTAFYFDGGNSQYCTGEAARSDLINTDHWSITDGGKNCLPAATTNAASLIAATSATFNGTVNAIAQNTAVTFEYGLDTTYGNTIIADQSPVTGETDTAVSKGMLGLTPNTLYHFRVNAVNATGTTYGLDQTFTTNAIAPTTTTVTSSLNPSKFGQTVTFTATVTSGAGTPTGTVTFKDGATTLSTTAMNSGVATLNTATLTVGAHTITANYNGDANFSTSTGTLTGGQTVVITSATATTNAASSITTSGATLNGTVNAKNDNTIAMFEYGLTTSYSSAVIAAPSPVTGTTDTAVNKAITGLLPHTAYHFRVDAVNSNGTTYGLDQTFTTSAAASPFSIISGGIEGQLGSVSITDNGSYTTQFTGLTITFNRDANNSGGGIGTDDVTNTANYLLIQTGTNGIYDTTSCKGGLASNDVQVPTGPVTYTNNGGNGPFTATVTVNNGTPLPLGQYRLFICGTTSITDQAGNPLNGGMDTQVTFSITNQSSNSGNNGAGLLPITGFPRGMITHLSAQPSNNVYTSTGLALEIPTLGVNAAIVGVPQTTDGWDVSWLGNNVGWLNGSAFPTWTGNSVITGHVWNADNTPGIFVNLKQLKYGDQIKVHAFGQIYTYEVRENRLVWPNQSDVVLQHEDRAYLTLLTCENYNVLFTTYSFRRMTRAVLIKVEAEP